MATPRKQVIRVVFDVLDERKHHLRLNEDLSVRAADPDEAIDWVFAEMQRQFRPLGYPPDPGANLCLKCVKGYSGRK